MLMMGRGEAERGCKCLEVGGGGCARDGTDHILGVDQAQGTRPPQVGIE